MGALLAPQPGLRVLAPARDWARAHAELVTCTAVLLVSLFHLGRVYNRGFNLLDEGFVLHVAERVLQGQVPYRDFFTQLTPGAFLALAAVFSVTGPSVLVGRWVTVVIGLLITALLYLGGRRVLSRPTAALTALAFPVWGIGQGWFYPNYSWFALAGCMVALECTLRAVAPAPFRTPGSGRPVGPAPHTHHSARPALLWATAAGLACGVAAFCKQNMGLFALLGLAGAVFLLGAATWRRRFLLALLMGLAALPVPLALVAWLAQQGALEGFLRDAVWIPLAVFPREMAAPYPSIWPPWPAPQDVPGQGAWIFRLVCLLPPLLYGLAALRLLLLLLPLPLRRPQHPQHTAHPGAEAVWLAFALAIWATAFPRADFDHVQVALGPAFVVGAVVMEAAGRLLVRYRVWRLWGAPDLASFTLKAGAPEAPPLRRLQALLQRIDGAACRRALPQALAGAILAGFLLAGLDYARALHMGPTWTLRTLSGVAPRAAGILLDHDDAAELRLLVQEVRRLSAPGESIVSLPWNAGIYFLAERRNATRYDLFIPASVLPEYLPEITSDLDEARLIVYWTARDSFINNTSLDDRVPELHLHLTSRYRAVAAINAYRLLLRE
jgi:hypothetical protein